MIQCPFTITITPPGGSAIVLVPAGGWIEALPEFAASQDVFESEGIKAGHAFFRPLGAVVVSVQIVAESDHDDLLEALEAFLDAGEALLEGTVRFTRPGGGAPTVFPDSVVSVVTPSLPSGPTATTLRNITIKTSLPS